MLQTLPRSADAYGRAQRREIGAAVAAIARLWRRMGPEFDASYAQIEGQVLAVLDAAQERVATGALAYIPDVLEETRQRVRPAQYARSAARASGHRQERPAWSVRLQRSTLASSLSSSLK